MSNKLENTSEAIPIETRKVFINNFDSYHGQAICEILNETLSHSISVVYKIIGSVTDLFEEDHKHLVHEIIDRNDEQYFNKIMTCEVIIYDISSKDETIIKEIEQFFFYLEAKVSSGGSSNENYPKYFILISTPLTWANTNLSDNNHDGVFIEENYRKRRPHPQYVEHKYIEKMTMMYQNQLKPYLRTIVLCTGVTYGGCNDVFHYIFRNAYYNQDIPVFHSGTQIIPLIYIKDFARIVRTVIENFPKLSNRYLFAVQPQFLSAKYFTCLLAKGLLGNIFNVKVLQKDDNLPVDAELIPEFAYDCITLDLKLFSPYFKNFDFISDFSRHSNFVNILIDEYFKARHLKSIKIIIDGPPCVGKTTVAKSLSEYFKIHYVAYNNLIDDTLKLLELNITKAISFLESTNKSKIEENVDENFIELETEGHLALERWKIDYQTILQFKSSRQKYVELEMQLNKENGIKKEYEDKTYNKSEKVNLENEEAVDNLIDANFSEIDSQTKGQYNSENDSEINVVYENNTLEHFEIIKKCLFILLLSKPYDQNQGYVIDEFPFTYQELEQLFGVVASAFKENNEEELEITDEEDDSEEESINKYDRFDIHEIKEFTTIPKPKYVIIMNGSEDLLLERAKNSIENKTTEQQILEKNLIKKFTQYQKRNEEDTSLVNYFLDNDIIVITIQITSQMTKSEIFENLKNKLEMPSFLPITDFERKAILEAEEQKKFIEEVTAKQKREEIELIERERREKNLQEWTRKYERIKEEEQELLEIRSLPLRQYLSKYVLPVLQDGLLEIVKVKPDDPYDFLSEYMYKSAMKVENSSSSSSTAEEKRKLLSSIFSNEIEEDLSECSFVSSDQTNVEDDYLTNISNNTNNCQKCNESITSSSCEDILQKKKKKKKKKSTSNV